MRHLWFCALLLIVAPAARGQDCGGSDTADSADPGPDTSDCDGDGWSVAQGDCDDTDPAVHPGARERCGNTIDDDCDGRDDSGEDCDPNRQDGSLGGGSACGTGGYAVLLVVPLWARGRRRAARP